MSVSIEVPDGAHAIIVSDQLLDQYRDWTRIGGPTEFGSQYKQIEVMVEEDGPLAEVHTRYVEVPTERAFKQLSDGAIIETNRRPIMERR